MNGPDDAGTSNIVAFPHSKNINDNDPLDHELDELLYEYEELLSDTELIQEEASPICSEESGLGLKELNDKLDMLESASRRLDFYLDEINLFTKKR